MELNEVRKEDETYYNGVFWIQADSVHDILTGKFNIVGRKFSVDYEGNYQGSQSVREMTHKYVWEENMPSLGKSLKDIFEVPVNYFPRIRSNVYKGQVYINLPSLMNIPKIIDKVIDLCNYEKLKNNINIDNNEKQGSHYDFLLK